MDPIDRFLAEDLGKQGDITSNALFSNEQATAVITAKDDCVIAGLEEASTVFKKTGAIATTNLHDGETIKKGTPVLNITGSVRSILKGERLALNFICRMSGIASETHTLIQRCRAINPMVTIAVTRKTTPGFRFYEKKAVILGSGEPHRMGLYDAVMIKDNHLKIIGSVEKALERIQKTLKNKPIEIEVENEQDALTAARMNVNCIMLDNFDPVIGGQVAPKNSTDKFTYSHRNIWRYHSE